MFKYEGNRMAVLSCDVLAQNRAPFNVLYVYGPNGCGKTALLDYLESEIYKRNPDRTVARFRANNLNNADWSDRRDFINFAQTQDVVMIDDFNLMENTEMSHDIGYLINHMFPQNRKLVITGNKHFEEYTKVDSLFKSVMKWEMFTKITPPNYEDCLNALRETGQNLTKCSPKVLEEIYMTIVNAEGLNLGNILSTFRRIVVRAEMNNIPLSVNYATDVIYDGAEIELIGS